VTQVDIAPTLLTLAGVDVDPERFDGRSFAHLIAPSLGGAKEAQPWREAVFFEYYYVDDNDKCVENCKPLSRKQEYPNADSLCANLTPFANSVCWGGSQCNMSCYPTETLANNFIAIRSMPGSTLGDTLYAEFQYGSQIKRNISFDAVDFVELYNATADPWMMKNLAAGADGKIAPPSKHPLLHAALRKFFECKGSTCP